MPLPAASPETDLGPGTLNPQIPCHAVWACHVGHDVPVDLISHSKESIAINPYLMNGYIHPVLPDECAHSYWIRGVNVRTYPAGWLGVRRHNALVDPNGNTQRSDRSCLIRLGGFARCGG